MAKHQRREDEEFNARLPPAVNRPEYPTPTKILRRPTAKDSEADMAEVEDINMHKNAEAHEEMIHNVPKIRHVSFIADSTTDAEFDKLIRDIKLDKSRLTGTRNYQMPR